MVILFYIIYIYIYIYIYTRTQRALRARFVLFESQTQRLALKDRWFMCGELYARMVFVTISYRSWHILALILSAGGGHDTICNLRFKNLCLNQNKAMKNVCKLQKCIVFFHVVS